MRIYEAGQCDIVVIGAGHAGIEAALAAAEASEGVDAIDPDAADDVAPELVDEPIDEAPAEENGEQQENVK